MLKKICWDNCLDFAIKRGHCKGEIDCPRMITAMGKKYEEE